MLTLSHLEVVFDGNLRNFTIRHASDAVSTADAMVQVHQVPLEKATPNSSSSPSSPTVSRSLHTAIDFVGSADLSLVPGMTKIFSLDHVPRESGEVEVGSVTLCLEEDDFDLEVIITEDEHLHQDVFWLQGAPQPTQKRLRSGRSNNTRIRPKPPKMRLEISDIRSTYFTNESIGLVLQITNGEQEETEVILDARLLGPPDALPTITWTTNGVDYGTGTDVGSRGLPDHGNDNPTSKSIGKLATASHQVHDISIQATSEAAEYVLEIRARYHLLSDPETPVSKSFSANLVVVLPFEVSYSFAPMIHPEPWPNYFNVEEPETTDDAGNDEVANGLIQRWFLTSRLYSLADIPLEVTSMEAKVLEVHEAAICKVFPSVENSSTPMLIIPKDLREGSFALEIQKTDLEDRRSTFLNLRLEVRWRRDEAQGLSAITVLAVPELIIPFGEPRVMATAQNGENPPGVIHLDYIIENPSIYTLTFNLTMETSEEFAFSGAKNVAMELLPISRHTVRYNLMPLVKGAWISPQFRVFDTHFHKTLKINATEGMRSDKKGISVWVDADG